jgi:uncharacterized membrane protein YfhO
MKGLRVNFKKYSNNIYLPILIIVVVIFIFFYKVFLYKLVPFPGDFIVGTYYPWLDYKWGYEVGVPVKNPILSDVASLVWPRRSLAVDILKSGQLPLWNKYSFTGYPLYAIYPTGVMSPTFFLYFLLPKIWAWTTQVISQHIVAAIFTYVLLRHLKLSKLSSVFGGLIYAFSGFNIIWSQWNSHTLVASWIPLMLYVVDKFLEKRKSTWGVILSILFALQVFSGYPQIVFYSIFAVFLWVFIRSKSRIKVLIHTLIFISVGLMLTSIQSLPAAELFVNSQRAIEALDKDLIFLPWQNIITLFAPDYFGNHSTGNFWGVGNYTLNTGYAGIVAFILATVGILANRSRNVTRYFLIILILSILLSLKTPLSLFITTFPFVGGAASPTRILILLNLAISVLAAFGVESLFENKRFSIIVTVVIPSTIIFGVLLASVFLIYNNSGLLDTGYMLDVGVRNLVLPTLLLMTTIILLLIYQNISILRKYIVPAVCVLAIVELFRFGWKFTPFSNVEYVFPATPSIEFLMDQKRPGRLITLNTIPANMWSIYGLESSAGYDNLYSKYYAKYVAVLNSGKVNATPQSRYATIDKYKGTMLDITNAKYFLVNNNDKDIYNSVLNAELYEEVFNDKSTTVFRNKSALPRAKMYYDWQIESDDQEILNQLVNDNFDINKKLLLVKGEENHSKEFGKSIINFIDYEDNSYLINVQTSQSGYLFVSDNYYPGWKAFVDNSEVEIVRANYTFRAVYVTKGNHFVEFIYDPKSFKIGKRMSLGTLVLLVGLLIYVKKSKKRS